MPRPYADLPFPRLLLRRTVCSATPAKVAAPAGILGPMRTGRYGTLVLRLSRTLSRIYRIGRKELATGTKGQVAALLTRPPRRSVLGNPVSDSLHSRKPNFRRCGFSETPKHREVSAICRSRQRGVFWSLHKSKISSRGADSICPHSCWEV